MAKKAGDTTNKRVKAPRKIVLGLEKIKRLGLDRTKIKTNLQLEKVLNDKGYEWDGEKEKWLNPNKAYAVNVKVPKELIIELVEVLTQAIQNHYGDDGTIQVSETPNYYYAKKDAEIKLEDRPRQCWIGLEVDESEEEEILLDEYEDEDEEISLDEYENGAVN